MPGPAAIPIERKRARGNPGHQRLPVPVVILPMTGTVDLFPPDDTSEGAELVRAIMQSGAEHWIGEPDRLSMLRMLGEAWNERRHLRNEAAKLDPSWIYGKTMPVVFTRLSDVEGIITKWLSALGLTPVDRAKLGVAEVRAQSSMEKLQGLREERRNRAG